MSPQEMDQKNRIFEVQELISVSDSAQLLTYRFQYDNILMWPFVRHMLMQGAINEMFSLKNPHAKTEKQSLLDIIRYIYTTIARNPFCISKGLKTDILFFSSGIVNVKEGSKYVNRLYDDFALEYPDKTLIIEDSCRRRYLTPRRFSKVLYHDLISFLTFPAGLIRKTSSKNKAAIENLILYLKDNFVYKFNPDFWDGVRQALHKVSRKLPGLHKQYLRLFKKLSPKIIFLEDANYGVRSYIIKWAKDLKVITAEIQHGAILHEHPAYNYGAAIFGSDYINYLPDFYLSNGKFWSEALATPSKTVNIGNPFLTNQLINVQKNGDSDSRYKLLITSAGTVPEFLVNLVQGLQNILPSGDFKLIFRPHPSELPFLNSRYKYILDSKIEIDLGSLYKTLPKVNGVLNAEFSTVVFEAAIFGKDVYILKSKLFTYRCFEKIFNYFDTLEELYKIITSGSKIKCDPKTLLDNDWRSNYRSFINNVVYAGKEGEN